ncbi:hypothetical protein [Pseudonocardia spinosispora]|uniref:hypothetical protein n=1 Tax=Pseudonocardia spinosispora TaxID=103441 RepID=UPI00048B0CD4|nr:hypothetical protein [Pseudonocardia spinosispora]
MSTAGGDYSGMLSDPLVPLDFGGWVRRVFRVLGRSFRSLALLALISAVCSTVGSIALVVVTPTREEAQRMVAEAKITDQNEAQGLIVKSILAYWPLFVVLAVVILLVSVLVAGASVYVAIRDANRQSGSIVDGIGFALPRLLPAVGWTILTGLIVLVALVVPMVPSMLIKSDVAGVIGAVVAFALVAYLGTTLFGSLFGVLFVDRAGIPRCFQLIKRRFWATFGRLVVAVLLTIPYLVAYFIVVGLLNWMLGPGSVAVAIVQAALTIPLAVYGVAVQVVTYAELRFWENTSIATRTLTSELNH